MAFYEDFAEKVVRFKSASQLRMGIAKIRRDEDRLFSLADGREKDHRAQYLHLSYQALLLQTLIEAESRPSLRRDLARELKAENLAPLVELAEEADRERVQRVFRRVGHARPHAAFVWHGAQLLIAAIGIAALLLIPGGLVRFVGIALLLGSLGWAATEFSQARRARLESRDVYRLLQDNVRNRLRLMRRMHEEIPMYY